MLLDNKRLLEYNYPKSGSIGIVEDRKNTSFARTNAG